ncbi:MAG: MurR/RpiR family transcriptional regulator [Clostridiales bacterium]|nr:MurR/RpiR family transcriptional regulator [Clostridiales bacterium]
MRLEERINRNYDRLTANDREIANSIFRDKQLVRTMNSTQLSEYLHISRTTFVRFMKKLDIHTFAEFKLLLTPEESKQAETIFNMNEIAESYHHMIDELREHDYDPICRLIARAETIYLYGSGNEQKAIAEELKRIFLIFGKYCVDLFDAGEVEFARSRFKKDDLFLAISLSGESRDALQVMQCVQTAEIQTASLTRWANNSLAVMCQENLYVGTKTVHPKEGESYEMVASFYILLDILTVRYLEYRQKLRGEDNGESGRNPQCPL